MNTKDKTFKDEVIYAMTYVFHCNEIDRKSLGIVSIKTNKNLSKKQCILTIELERPGIFIGRKGQLIDSIKNHLEKTLKLKFIIDLKETKMWRNEYYDYMDVADNDRHPEFDDFELTENDIMCMDLRSY